MHPITSKQTGSEQTQGDIAACDVTTEGTVFKGDE